MAQYIIPTIFTAVDRLSGPVMGMQRAMMGFSTVAGVEGAKLQRNLRATSDAAMQVAMSAAMIGAALVIPLGLATKAAMDFEKQMTNVATLVDTTRENMGAMGDAVLEVSKRVPVAISDLTESLYQIRSAGVGAKDAMHVLEVSAKLSVAGLSSATDATKAVTSAMVSFKWQSLTTEQIANSFFLTVKEGKTKMEALNESFGATALIAGNAGVTLQEFNAATAALTNTGLTASEAQVGLRGAIIALIKPSTEMTDVLTNMGYTGTEAGLNLIKAMGGLVPALEAVDKGAAKAGDSINKAFGKVQGLVVKTALTGAQHGAFLQNMAEQSAGKDNLTEAYAKQLGTTAAQAQIAKNQLVILGIRIGELLLPALTAITKALIPVVEGLSNFARNHKTLSKIIIGSIGTIGLLSVAVAGVSFMVYGVTKAIFLWNGAMYAYNVVAGASAVLTGKLAQVGGMLNIQMAAAPGFARGATIAMGGWAAVLSTVITRMNLTIAGLALIVAYKDQIQGWGNDAGWGRWWNAHTGNKSDVNESLAKQYKTDPNAARQYMTEHPTYTAPGMDSTFKDIDRTRELERIYKDQQKTMEDKMLQDSNGKTGIDAEGKPTTAVYLNVNVDRSGGVTVDNKGGNGAIPVYRKETGSWA